MSERKSLFILGSYGSSVAISNSSSIIVMISKGFFTATTCDFGKLLLEVFLPTKYNAQPTSQTKIIIGESMILNVRFNAFRTFQES